jgi:hypothetical protein
MNALNLRIKTSLIAIEIARFTSILAIYPESSTFFRYYGTVMGYTKTEKRLAHAKVSNTVARSQRSSSCG